MFVANKISLVPSLKQLVCSVRSRPQTGDPSTSKSTHHMPIDFPKTRQGTVYNRMTEVTVTVATALPQFSMSNPRAWFRLANARFSSSGLTSDDDKINKVLEALPPAVFDKLAPWLETQPEVGASYTALKTELLATYSGSKPTRKQKILQLLTHPESEQHAARW